MRLTLIILIALFSAASVADSRARTITAKFTYHSNVSLTENFFMGRARHAQAVIYRPELIHLIAQGLRNNNYFDEADALLRTYAMFGPLMLKIDGEKIKAEPINRLTNRRPLRSRFWIMLPEFQTQEVDILSLCNCDNEKLSAVFFGDDAVAFLVSGLEVLADVYVAQDTAALWAIRKDPKDGLLPSFMVISKPDPREDPSENLGNQETGGSLSHSSTGNFRLSDWNDLVALSSTEGDTTGTGDDQTDSGANQSDDSASNSEAETGQQNDSTASGGDSGQSDDSQQGGNTDNSDSSTNDEQNQTGSDTSTGDDATNNTDTEQNDSGSEGANDDHAGNAESDSPSNSTDENGSEGTNDNTNNESDPANNSDNVNDEGSGTDGSGEEQGAHEENPDGQAEETGGTNEDSATDGTPPSGEDAGSTGDQASGDSNENGENGDTSENGEEANDTVETTDQPIRFEISGALSYAEGTQWLQAEFETMQPEINSHLQWQCYRDTNNDPISDDTFAESLLLPVTPQMFKELRISTGGGTLGESGGGGGGGGGDDVGKPISVKRDQ